MMNETSVNEKTEKSEEIETEAKEKSGNAITPEDAKNEAEVKEISAEKQAAEVVVKTSDYNENKKKYSQFSRSHSYDNETVKKRKTVGSDAVFCRPLEINVNDDKLEQAIRQLKNRMAREGILRELKNRRHYFKPSELKRIKSREAERRRRKQARQRVYR